jgi:hypothetical protein
MLLYATGGWKYMKVAPGGAVPNCKQLPSQATPASQTAQNWDTANVLSLLNACTQAGEEAAQGQLRAAEDSTATAQGGLLMGSG